MSRVAFDHIAIAVPRIGDALPFLVGELGGRPVGGGLATAFAFRQWTYGGGKLEVLEPAGPAGGFLHRFLERRGPGVHHVTLHVPDLDAACEHAGELGFPVVGRDESDPGWKEAFLHPKGAMSLVVQMVEVAERSDGEEESRPSSPELGDPEAGALGIELVGLRVAVVDVTRARRLWGTLLGGTLRSYGGAVEVRWPGSVMRLLVSRTADVEREGPTAVELACLRPVVLPSGPHPLLGTVFEPVDITELPPPPREGDGDSEVQTALDETVDPSGDDGETYFLEEP